MVSKHESKFKIKGFFCEGCYGKYLCLLILKLVLLHLCTSVRKESSTVVVCAAQYKIRQVHTVNLFHHNLGISEAILYLCILMLYFCGFIHAHTTAQCPDSVTLFTYISIPNEYPSTLQCSITVITKHSH